MDADGPGFTCSGGIDGLDKRHVETAADGKSLGKNCRSGKHAAVGAFFILEKRDLQPRLSKRDFLKLIEVLGLLLSSFVENGIGQGKETSTGTDFIGVSSRRETLARLHLFGNGFSQ